MFICIIGFSFNIRLYILYVSHKDFRDPLQRQLRSRKRSSFVIDKRVHKKFAEWFSRRVCIFFLIGMIFDLYILLKY